jgi:hypothetical protein
VAHIEVVTKRWMQLGQSNSGFLDGIFLCASRYMAKHQSQQKQQQRFYTNLATRYKVKCVRALSDAISSNCYEDSVIGETLILACDEVSAYLTYGHYDRANEQLRRLRLVI